MEQEAKIAIERLEKNSTEIRLLLLQIETNLKIIQVEIVTGKHHFPLLIYHPY